MVEDLEVLEGRYISLMVFLKHQHQNFCMISEELKIQKNCKRRKKKKKVKKKRKDVERFYGKSPTSVLKRLYKHL